MKIRQVIAASAVAFAALAALLGTTTGASAAITLADNYYGGDDTYSGNQTYGAVALSGAGSTLDGAQLYAANVISDANDPTFDIAGATISRSGPGNNTLNITINTNYAGNAGEDGTGYGALFLTPGANAWHPTGSALNGYATDVYQPGEWQYAFTIPMLPGTSSGNGSLYATKDGTVVMSNVSQDATTYPLAGNNGWYFRQGQAVQFTPNAGANAVDSGTWTVGVGTLTFSIVDNHALGNNFALSWAMTCANNVLQGQVSDVPEPATWTMLLLGFFGVGFMVRGSRKKEAVAVVG